MRIVLVSDHETAGGAAVATTRLASALCEAGHEVLRLVHVASEAGERPWQVRRVAGAVPERLRTLVGRQLVGARVRRRWIHRAAAKGLEDALDELMPDVVNVHNLHGAEWSPGLLELCCRVAPTAVTLHDMWSFTGRCAYSYDCRKFIAGCDHLCPTPHEYPTMKPSLIRREWQLRQRVLAENAGLVAVAPSRWLRREARAGLWRGHRVERIPYGLPLGSYRPEDREFARKALAVRDHGPVLLAVAANLEERRKGADILARALERIGHRPLTLLTIGHGRVKVDAPGFHVEPLGYLEHERTMVLAYNAADLLVHPAPVDNLPNVVLEAIACGTPVAALPVGGLPDLVRPGRSGWLADAATPDALAAVVERALADLAGGCDLRASCRALAEAEYSAELQATRYVELFESVIAGAAS